MTVLVESSSRSIAGDDASTVFPTGFMFLDSTHLTVTLIDGAVETLLVEDVDYTVDGEGDAAGGDVTLSGVLASGTTLHIERSTPLLQEVDLRPEGDFEADTVEGMDDKSMLILQEHEERLAALEALSDLVTVADVADAVSGTLTTFNTDAAAVEATFPFNVAVAGGEGASNAIFRVFPTGNEGFRFDTPPFVQWKPGATPNTITILSIDGLDTGTNYTLKGMVFF